MKYYPRPSVHVHIVNKEKSIFLFSDVEKKRVLGKKVFFPYYLMRFFLVSKYSFRARRAPA